MADSARTDSEDCREMVRYFGGDGLATRAAYALSREGLTSMSKLANLLRREENEEQVFRRLMDIPVIGRGTLDRIREGLGKYMEQTEGEGE
jgi:hypothetical protein